MLVFNNTLATCAKSVPARGSCGGRPSSASFERPCNAKNKSSSGRGKVRALPRAPNRCRGMCALALRGSAACASCRVLSSYRASMVMQTKVVMQGLAQNASMTVTLCWMKYCGAHMSFANASAGSAPVDRESLHLLQMGSSHPSQRSRSSASP